MSENIVYQSEEILEFYSANRQSWDEFYPSEKWVFEKIAGEAKSLGTVLDVGCAGGGLGKALCEQYKLKSYTGNDIHYGIINWAKKNQQFPMEADFIAGDIADLSLRQKFDLVVSLGCADWNIKTDHIIQSCWKKVKPGGYFMVSLRLTDREGINDIQQSFQNINFTGDDQDPEVANYVVMNYREAVRMFENLSPQPSRIGAYGYWGAPSQTARTPYEQILFSVFYVQKRVKPVDAIVREFEWPDDISTEEV